MQFLFYIGVQETSVFFKGDTKLQLSYTVDLFHRGGLCPTGGISNIQLYAVFVNAVITTFHDKLMMSAGWGEGRRHEQSDC